MRPATEIVRRVLQSEKGARLAKQDQYILDVSPRANKTEIRQAVQQLFNVTVTDVNTLITHGKWRRLQTQQGRRSDRKKAIVTLAKGQKIEVKT